MPSPTTKHHAEWLSLLEISGPFLSMPVLLNTFPQGLDDFPPEQARTLKADYEFWKENIQEPAVFTAWVNLVLESMLGYSEEVLLRGQSIPGGIKAEFPEHEETLRPDMVLAEPATHKPRLLIQVYPPSQSLDKPVQGGRWQASIATRMMELLHATEIRLGLVTNGEQWMLVDAPRGETTGFTAWYAGLWFDEPLTLRAFRSLLGAGRFFGVPDDQALEALLAASAKDQQEITDQLGLQVRHAVEILIQMIDRADQTLNGKLFGDDVKPALLYEAALTFMMRLVFMLAAEERKLLPLDDNVYAENYAVSTLRAQLRELADQYGEDVLERRYDAWSRLLAVFRAVYHGIQHDRLHLPPYGGSLFDPDRYPFLEGRPANSRWQDSPAQPLPVNNRTVLHLLEALQILQVQVPGGGPAEARRLSFRALDVEQIGHVYEGLLDHIAVRASEPVLGLQGAKRQEPEIALSELEQARDKSDAALLDLLKDVTGRSESALKNGLGFRFESDPQAVDRLRRMCGDEKLYRRVLPFAGLLRGDDFGDPAVILLGSVYVTAGTTRRATGTHYTPRVMTEPIVGHTLEPLVYEGPAEGWPRQQWRLRSPADILDLKVCDMAMGSGGFLVQSDRYLAERLVEAWGLLIERLSLEHGRPISITPTGEIADDPAQAIPAAADDRLILARRLVAERCLYGVDKNPLAVEIAKLSLWLVTLAKERPFTFLDHALKCGDSLVGASEDVFLRWAHGYQSSTMTLFDAELRGQLEGARAKRRELENFLVRDVKDAERKAGLLAEAEAALEHVKRGCDLLTGARLLGLSAKESEDLQFNMLLDYMAGNLDGSIDPKQHFESARALHAAQKERAFHWEFEFPEVFERGGFSAFLGNPPFLGGTRISTLYGTNYLSYLQSAFHSFGSRADLCSLFFIKTFSLLKKSGIVGLIATNTISQGDTRESGLDYIIGQGGIIINATSSMPWPNQAAVAVSIVSIIKGAYSGTIKLDNIKVLSISPMLDASENSKPFHLQNNLGRSFNGSKLDGIGFVIDTSEAQSLINLDRKNQDILFPYLNGDDLNSNPDQSPSRWIIYFRDWEIHRAMEYTDCFNIVRKRVYPERQKHKEDRTRKHWWQFQRIRQELYDAVNTLEFAFAIPRVSKYLSVTKVLSGIIYSDALIIVTSSNWQTFSIIQSSIHDAWARKYASTLETRLRYTPTDCFETFPFPENLSGLIDGETYHETRRQIMLARQEGLTKTYNRFHDPSESTSDIAELRRLHVEMDHAVAAAYGWSDLELGHDFHETAQGTRYTISESARREVLSRLLQLNHERYEEEVQAGLHEKGGNKAGGKKKEVKKAKRLAKPKIQPELFATIDAAMEETVDVPAEGAGPTPVDQIGAWDQCVCLGCGKHLVGFSVAEHTEKVHQGVDLGYRKVGG
jgi:hypothetical protein